MGKLLILSSDTGEGHNSAARALEATAAVAGLKVTVRKPLEESGKLNRALGSLYNAILTRCPATNGQLLLARGSLPPERTQFPLRKRPQVYRAISGFREARHRSLRSSDAEPFHPAFHQRGAAGHSMPHVFDGSLPSFLAGMGISLGGPVLRSNPRSASGTHGNGSRRLANRTGSHAGSNVNFSLLPAPRAMLSMKR